MIATKMTRSCFKCSRLIINCNGCCVIRDVLAVMWNLMPGKDCRELCAWCLVTFDYKELGDTVGRNGNLTLTELLAYDDSMRQLGISWWERNEQISR
jgi:hypothetical protein